VKEEIRQRLIDGQSVKVEAAPRRGHKRPRVEVYLSDDERRAVEAAIVKEVLDRGEAWEPGAERIVNFIRRALLEVVDLIEGNDRSTRFPGQAWARRAHCRKRIRASYR